MNFLPVLNTDGSMKFPGVGATVAQFCATVASCTATAGGTQATSDTQLAADSDGSACTSEATCSYFAVRAGQQAADGGAFAGVWTSVAAGRRRQLSGSDSVLSDGEPWHDSRRWFTC